MRRGLVRRQRKCINLMELVRSRSRFHPYINQRCGKTNSSCSRSYTSRSHGNGSDYCNVNRKINIGMPRSSFGMCFLRPPPPSSGSRRNSADSAPQKRHISTSTHCRPVQRQPPVAAARSERVDRAMNTQLTCRSVHTQYEPCACVSVATSSLRLECAVCAEHAALYSKHLESANLSNINSETTTTSIEVQTHSDVTAAAAATSTSSLRANTVDRSTSQVPLPAESSARSSPSEPAQSRSEPDELPQPNIELQVMGAEESTESDDEDEEDDERGSGNEESASDNTVAESQSDLALQVQQVNAEEGAAAMDADGAPLADEEAGGDGHHNNSVIEIEITLRSSNDTNSEDDEDEDEEEEEERDAALDEESE